MGSYVTVSTKVRREIVERAKRLGLTSLSFCGESSKRKLRRER